MISYSSTRLYSTIWHIIHEDALCSCSSLTWPDHARLLMQVSIRGKFMNENCCVDLTHKYKFNKHTCSCKYSLPVFGLSMIAFKTQPHTEENLTLGTIRHCFFVFMFSCCCFFIVAHYTPATLLLLVDKMLSC